MRNANTTQPGDISLLNGTDNQLLQGIAQKSDVALGLNLPPRRNSDREVTPVLPTKYLTPNMDALKQVIESDSP